MVGPRTNIGSRMKPHISGKAATYVPLEAAKRGPMRGAAVTASRHAAVFATGTTRGHGLRAAEERPPTPLRRAQQEDAAMRGKKSSADNNHRTLVADDREASQGTLKRIGGSQSDH